jgi:hypothetical protein
VFFVNPINVVSELIGLVLAGVIVLSGEVDIEQPFSYLVEGKHTFFIPLLLPYCLFPYWLSVSSMTDYALIRLIEFDECILDGALVLTMKHLIAVWVSFKGILPISPPQLEIGAVLLQMK